MAADCVYIGIGNSDNKLSQADWSAFAGEVAEACTLAGKVIGVWFSEPTSRYQNGCICLLSPKPAREKWLRGRLGDLAKEYLQDSISWAAARTEMITEADGGH